MAKLEGAVALVTGGSSGIGEAIARLFAVEGASVMIVYHDEGEHARRIVDEITAAGGKASRVGADVGVEADAANAFAETRRAFADPTILVNSAGEDSAGAPVGDMPAAQFEAVLRTNLVGPFLFCSEFVRGLRPLKKPGRILNITSVHEDIPRAGASDYCASKGALRNLTRCMALELAEHGITVNNIAPGMVLTPMNQKALDDPEVLKQQVASIPMKRAAEPAEVAELALYLATAGRYASGATFTLDGALSMNLGQGA